MKISLQRGDFPLFVDARKELIRFGKIDPDQLEFPSSESRVD